MSIATIGSLLLILGAIIVAIAAMRVTARGKQ